MEDNFTIASKQKAKCNKCGYIVESYGVPFGFKIYEEDFCLKCLADLLRKNCGIMNEES